MLQICRVTDGKQTYCGDYHAMYTNVESLCCTPETNTMLYCNYTAIKKKKKRNQFYTRPSVSKFLRMGPKNGYCKKVLLALKNKNGSTKWYIWYFVIWWVWFPKPKPWFRFVDLKLIWFSLEWALRFCTSEKLPRCCSFLRTTLWVVKFEKCKCKNECLFSKICQGLYLKSISIWGPYL